MKIKAKKSLGQNFLQDTDILETIANFYDISGKNILEVGPGYGALTEYLLQKNPKAIHLVELDSDMIQAIQYRQDKGELQANEIDFQIFHQDILRFEPKFENYSVIANIPYYITSPILSHFLYTVKNKPQKMLIMMQKEVGERILEGSSVLSLTVAKKCFVEKVCDVPRTAFYPAPKVDSIVLAFETHHLFDDIPDERFLPFIKSCFAEPRKKLQNNLLKGGYEKQKITQVFAELGLDEMIRGEALSVDMFVELMKIQKR